MTKHKLENLFDEIQRVGDVDWAEVHPEMTKLNPKAVADAKTFVINHICLNYVEMPKVVPMMGGRLQFEWYAPTHDLEIEFDGGRKIHYLLTDLETDYMEEEIVNLLDFETVSRIVFSLVGPA